MSRSEAIVLEKEFELRYKNAAFWIRALGAVVALLLYTEKVGGSNPSVPTILENVATPRATTPDLSA